MEAKVRAQGATGPDAGGTAPTQVWMQRVSGCTVVPALIRQLGADPDAVLATAGLTPADLDSPQKRVPFAALARALQEAARGTATPHFGLLVGRAWRLEHYGALGTMVRHSATVREALATFIAHQHANSDSGITFLWERGGVAELGHALYNGGTYGVDQVYDCALALATGVMRELCGAGWEPSAVLVSHAGPGDVRHYRSFFRVVPRFDCEYSALRFPAALLDVPVTGAQRERWREAADRLAAAPPPSLLQAVMRTLRLQLLEGETSGDSVAAALGLHRRTLNRRLRDEGTTFQRCLDLVRFQVACQLLTSSQVPLDDIAATLGYASVSPFMRTFRRWSGTTPAQWRRVAGAPAAPAADHGRRAQAAEARP